VCIQAQRLRSKSAAKIIKEQAAEIPFSIIANCYKTRGNSRSLINVGSYK